MVSPAPRPGGWLDGQDTGQHRCARHGLAYATGRLDRLTGGRALAVGAAGFGATAALVLFGH